MIRRGSFVALALLGAGLALAFLGCAKSSGGIPANSPATVEITALLQNQAAAWNRGDIDGFMAGYAPIDDLRFASGDSITYGWRPTLERYKSHYPDRATMGTLTFSDIAVTELAPDAAIAFGRWSLTRAKDRPHGLFTLTLRKTAAGWRIIQDHTSAASP
jgi:ketosteroid isomerase-like protein